MKIVAIDTNVLILGVARREEQQHRELHDRARILFRTLEEQRVRVVISAVTVAEFLAGVPTANHSSLLGVLTKRFMCATLDVQAAAIAADIWQRHRKLPAQQQISRQLLKADSLIIASLKSANAELIYSHDSRLRKLAGLVGMDARDLPTHHENMFIDREERRP